MKNVGIHVLTIFFIICIFFLISIFIIKDQYDNALIDKINQNEKLKKENEEKNLVIESLLDGVECTCGWYETFYYEHAKDCGAFE